MRRAGFWITLALMAAWPSFASAAPTDGRFRLGLTEPERAEFLAEMRQMLVSIQGILDGIANGDRAQIAEAARYSGNRMARATPDAVRARLPAEFKALGGPTHLLFEEIVIRSATDEATDLIRLTSTTMQQCAACHALYRAD